MTPDHLRRLSELATPGEWRVETQTLDSLDYDTDEPQVYVVHPGTVCTDTVVATMGETSALTTAQKQANAALIVEMRNSLPQLLARITALEAALEPFAKALGDIAGPDKKGWPDDEDITLSAASEMITWGDLRRAQSALQSGSEVGGLKRPAGDNEMDDAAWR